MDRNFFVVTGTCKERPVDYESTCRCSRNEEQGLEKAAEIEPIWHTDYFTRDHSSFQLLKLKVLIISNSQPVVPILNV